jgi:hypothetical protein
MFCTLVLRLSNNGQRVDSGFHKSAMVKRTAVEDGTTVASITFTPMDPHMLNSMIIQLIS